MMRYLVLAVLTVLVVLAQSEMGQNLLFLPGRPDFPLVLVLAWATLNGSRQGTIAGIAVGVLLDSVGYLPSGINGALLGILGFVAGIPLANTYRGNLPFFLTATLAATMCYHGATFLLLQAYGWSMPPIAEMLQTAIVAAILNALLVMPAYSLCRRVLRGLGGWTELKI